jgi:hypothetical protein
MIRSFLITISLLVLFPLISSAQIMSGYSIPYHYNQKLPDDYNLTKFIGFIHTLDKETILSISVIASSDSVGGEEGNLKIGKARYLEIEKILKQEIQPFPPLTFENKGSIIQKKFKLSNEDARFVEVRFFLLKRQMDELDRIDTLIPEEIVSFPPAQEEKAKKDYKGKTIVTSIFFVGDKSKYLGDPSEELERIYTIYKEQPNLHLIISGHTCCKDKVALSKKRAKSVYRALRKLGIPRSKMVYEGCGNKRPLVLEVDEEARQKNRRVEVTFP